MSGMKDLLGDDLFQPRSPFPSTAERAKSEAMDRVDQNADEAWKARMYGFVIEIAQRLRRFTSDDVFDLAAERGWDGGTHDLRAFGPIMMRAAKGGVCRKADCAPVNSRRASLHASPRAVWESLIFGKAAA